MVKRLTVLVFSSLISTAAVVLLMFFLKTGFSGVFHPAMAAPQSPIVTAVDPTEAPNDLDTLITITGTGFTAVPTVTLGSTLLEDISWISAKILTATVPWGMQTGVYALTVENPGGESGRLTGAFTVTKGMNVWSTYGPYGGDVFQVILNPETPTTAYAVMSEVGMFARYDNGANWEPILSAEPCRMTLDSQDSDVIYVMCGGFAGDNLRSMDGGLTWEVFFDEFRPQNGAYTPCHAPHPTSGGEIYLGTGSADGIPLLPGEGGIYYSDDYEGRG